MHINELLKISEVMERTGMCRTALYAEIKRKKFAEPVRLGVRKVRWLLSDVNDWFARHIEERGK